MAFDFLKPLIIIYLMAVRAFLKTHWSAILGGALLVLSFPRFDLYPLAWVALSPFLVSLYSMSRREAFFSGLLMGLVYFFGTEYWIYHSVHYYGSVPFLPSLLLVLLLSLYMSIYTAVFSALFAFKIKTTRLPAMALAPLFWVSLELLRSYALTGFPWSSLGYSQYRFLHMIQFADITGIYGVSFLMMAVNGAIADIFITKRKVAEMPLYSPFGVAAGYVMLVIAVFGAFIYGYIRLRESRTGSPLRVSVVQASIEQDVKWDPAYQSEVLRIYNGLTLEASAQNPNLIVWPETAIPFYWERDKALTESMVEFQKTLGTYLLFGAITVRDETSGKINLANSAVLLDQEGRVTYKYDKIHLVPFGEYVPLRKILFFVDRLATGIGDYVPGKEHLKANTPFGSFGTMICYEIIFPGLVRKFYSKDGDFIVTITNDAWFGTTNGPYQHWSMAVLRAVENRKPVIRAANTGISGFIDSSGRIISKTRLFERRVLTADIRTDSTRTFYSRYGDLFAYVATVLSLLVLIEFKEER